MKKHPLLVCGLSLYGSMKHVNDSVHLLSRQPAHFCVHFVSTVVCCRPLFLLLLHLPSSHAPASPSHHVPTVALVTTWQLWACPCHCPSYNATGNEMCHCITRSDPAFVSNGMCNMFCMALAVSNSNNRLLNGGHV